MGHSVTTNNLHDIPHYSSNKHEQQQQTTTQGIRFGAQPNGSSPTTQTSKHNTNTTKNPTEVKEFVGYNQGELKGVLVLEDATIKSYNILKERLETLVESGPNGFAPPKLNVRCHATQRDPSQALF
eukprot:jgi/Psemu1/27684/gm1.27684_g